MKRVGIQIAMKRMGEDFMTMVMAMAMLLSVRGLGFWGA
jgi:hypothetical protein